MKNTETIKTGSKEAKEQEVEQQKTHDWRKEKVE